MDNPIADLVTKVNETKGLSLSLDELKIAAKRAKKENQSLDQIKFQMLAEKGLPIVRQKNLEFAKNIAMLGYTLEPRLRITPQGMIPILQYQPIPDKAAQDDIIKRINNDLAVLANQSTTVYNQPDNAKN